MFDAKKYKLARENLLWDVLGLAGLIGSVLPPEAKAGSRFADAGGSQWNNDALRLISKKIEEIEYRFDFVQHALGLWQHDARFGHGKPETTDLPAEATTPQPFAAEEAAKEGKKPRRRRKAD